MVGFRDVVFVSLIGSSAIALGYNLMPKRESKPMTSFDLAVYTNPDFLKTVKQVDYSFQETWSSNGIKPTSKAENLQIARRLSLGLMGTIPSLEEIREFESLPEKDQLQWWVDHILQDQRFADYLGERLARSYVGTEDGPFVLYRRRRFVSWISDQIAKQQPYDQIVRHLIDDTGLWTDKPSTNFISVTAQQDKGNQPNPVRLAGRVTRAFLGLRLDCAECHNHPFAAWKQSDFEGISAFFAQTQLGFTGILDADGEYEVEDRKTQVKRVVAPKVPIHEELLPYEGTRRQRLAAWVTHRDNPYFAKAIVNRIWALMTGRALIDPVDNLETDQPVPSALQILADDFALNGYDLRRLIRIIASTRVFQLDSAAEFDIGETEEKALAVFPMSRLRPEQMASSVLQSASIATVDAESHIVLRLIRYGEHNNFVTRYGDTGEDEFEGRGGTIPQRLIMMNGEMVRERIKETPLNATTRIAMMAPNSAKAIEVAYLAVLSRRPTAEESAHFEKLMNNDKLNRSQRMEDLYWALINSTEFSWNH